jgi:hypothetical protein
VVTGNAPSEPIAQPPPAAPEPAGPKAAPIIPRPEPRKAAPPNPVAAKPPVLAKAESSSTPVVKRNARDESAASGRWITSWFTIGLGGNPQLSERTYATASIVDESGAARAPGGYLYVRNESDKHLLFYGLSNASLEKLEPGEEVTLALASRPGPQTPTTRRAIVLRWFDRPAVDTPLVAGELEPRGSTQAARAAESRIAVATARSASDAGAQAQARRNEAADTGRWITRSFAVGLGGNTRLMETTYATASVIDEAGAARTPGGYLYVRNESDRFPLYYGLHGAARDKLEPGEEVTLALRTRRSPPHVAITHQTVTFRWFDENATERLGTSSRQRN